MRFKFLLILLIVTKYCLSQDTIPVSKVDTLINFFSKRTLRLHPYNNRVVPFGSYYPVYVSINYEDGENKNFEYFRVDSSRYLVYEFFRNNKGSSNEGLKSAGIMRVTDKIEGTSTTGIIHIGRSDNKRSSEVHYFKALSKEGEWDEYEDSLFNHRFWTGKYFNNKKVGIWSNYIYDPNDDRLLQQIDYDKDSTKKIFSINLIGQLSIDSISYYLCSRWPIGCEDDADIRIPMMKCQLYDGHFGDDCNSRFGNIGYYEFFQDGKFKRQNGETCKKYKTYPTSGIWKIATIKEKLILEITLASKARIKYDILYLDRDGIMVADRQ